MGVNQGILKILCRYYQCMKLFKFKHRSIENETWYVKMRPGDVRRVNHGTDWAV